MSLIRLRDVSLSYGHASLLDNIQLAIEKGERVCLLGRNGQGKSSLLKIIAQVIEPDTGALEYTPGLQIAMLAQAVPVGAEKKSVFSVVVDGLGEAGQLILAYHELLNLAQLAPDDLLVNERLHRVHDAFDQTYGWGLQNQVEKTITRLDLDSDACFGSLSGGLKRRVLLAQALVSQPDILLLDEPTNHLDVESIQWLEQFLLQYDGTLIFVSHDRRFLKNLATRIVELDRGHITSCPGDYATYLKRKAEALSSEGKQQSNFDKKLAQEEVWIRQGVKARRTRNEGRVRKLEAMREERQQRRALMGKAHLKTQEAASSGKVVIEAKDISYRYDEAWIIRHFSTVMMRGDKIGILGANGCGKTTLLNLLLDQLEPTEGSVHHGTKLKISYFDQLRQRLDDDKSVLDNFAEGQSHVEINGKPQHVLGYLSRFLFSPEQARSPVKALSGGEKNRLLLAKLLAESMNVLVLDEPTNDLDLETLEILESMLVDYTGTLLLVSHDRDFLNNVVTSTLVFEGQNNIGEYVGGYDDWVRQRPKPAKKESVAAKPKEKQPQPAPAVKKISYQEQKELKTLPKKIEQLEKAIQKLHDAMGEPEYYQQDQAKIREHGQVLAEKEAALDKAYQRWELLDGL
jgi:ABC transport system ATP-binding/permease protein